MLQPDSQGCINVEWPSCNVPHGGIFHPKKVNYSKEGEEFLKVLLEESKLDILQRKSSDWELRHHEETSKRGCCPQAPPLRPRTSRRRSLSAIRNSGAFDVEHYHPRVHGEDRNKLKARLQQLMAYGDTGLSTTRLPVNSRRLKSPIKMLPSSEDMKNELLTQIRERINWLAEMEALGQGAKHRDVIGDQIAERLRRLDALGFNSTCLSARSNVSKLESPKSQRIETARSHEKIAENGKSGRISATKNEISPKSSDDSVKTDKSAFSIRQQNRRSKILSKSLLEEENVAAFDLITSLQCTPRRRC